MFNAQLLAFLRKHFGETGNPESPASANLKGLPAVGATLVVAPVCAPQWRQGDHKGRPYIIYINRPSRCSDPFRLADAGDEFNEN
jgi:hypothetical protein